jgi:tRNA-specific 2-thiouridylase
MEDGADFIATGHYARIHDGRLLTAKDTNKDQTYFLYRMNPAVLDRVLMPLGDYTKPEVREMAKDRDLSTADKKDSQGICFIGEVGIKEFLIAELGPQRPGEVIDEQGLIVGRHDGSIFYTIGQRHGLNIGGGLPYYVTGKNVDKNEVYVTRDISSGKLWTEQFQIGQLHWLVEPAKRSALKVRTRYRAALVDCAMVNDGDRASITLKEAVRAVTPGQSAVFYDGETVIGGGVVV